jgi:hypothetical protein
MQIIDNYKSKQSLNKMTSRVCSCTGMAKRKECSVSQQQYMLTKMMLEPTAILTVFEWKSTFISR